MDDLHVLLATAELSPLARVGGLGVACAGLCGELTRQGVNLDVVLPHYGFDLPEGTVLDSEFHTSLPTWLQELTTQESVQVSRARIPEIAYPVWLVDSPLISRGHPYLDGHGQGYADNLLRFLMFSSAVADLAHRLRPQVVHLNDWHTAAAAAWLPEDIQSVFTTHNLAYQETISADILGNLGPRHEAFTFAGHASLLTGAFNLASKLVFVSPTYAREVVTPGLGNGMEPLLRRLSAKIVGIRNGIDTDLWDPKQAGFSADELLLRQGARELFAGDFGFDPSLPTFSFLGRFTHQKGLDNLLELADYIVDMPANLAVLGTGESDLIAAAAAASSKHPRNIRLAVQPPDSALRRMYAGTDFVVVPSRFEPCGLVQMEAMTMGAVPVAADVGGLHDTIVDAREVSGNGFLYRNDSSMNLLQALWRAASTFKTEAGLHQLQTTGMTTDWSWKKPALAHMSLYEEVLQHN